MNCRRVFSSYFYIYSLFFFSFLFPSLFVFSALYSDVSYPVTFFFVCDTIEQRAFHFLELGTRTVYW